MNVVQFPGSSSRDMGDKGSVLVKEKNVSLHRHFEELMYSRTDGDWRIKLLLSSYTFMDYGAYVGGCPVCLHFLSPGGLSKKTLCRVYHPSPPFFWRYPGIRDSMCNIESCLGATHHS